MEVGGGETVTSMTEGRGGKKVQMLCDVIYEWSLFLPTGGIQVIKICKSHSSYFAFIVTCRSKQYGFHLVCHPQLKSILSAFAGI